MSRKFSKQIHMLKIWASTLLLTGSFIAVSIDRVKADIVDTPIFEAKQLFAHELNTDKVLINQNGDQLHAIASITKVIALYIVRDEIEKGTLTWDQQVTIDADIANLSQSPGLSNVPLYEGQSYSIKSLYEASFLPSANGAMMALAKMVAGSETAFAERMWALLESWGITEYRLYTSSGLPISLVPFVDFGDAPADAENELSARSLAIIVDHFLTDYPDVLETTKQSSLGFPGPNGSTIELKNTNELVNPGSLYHEGVDGFKTGTTDKSGYSLASTKGSGDKRFIVIALGATADSARFQVSSDVFNFLDTHANETEVVPSQVAINDATIFVPNGEIEEMSVMTNTPINMYGIFAPDSVDVNINNIEIDSMLVAPLGKGQAVGTMAVEYTDTLGYLTGESKQSVNLEVGLANDNPAISPTALLKRGWNYFKTNIRNLFNLEKLFDLIS